MESRTFAYYLGSASIKLENLKFANTGQLNVSALRSLRRKIKEDCHRLDPRHHVPAVIDPVVLEQALQISKKSSQELRSSNGSYIELKLPFQHDLECLHGRHRIAAAKDSLQGFDRWWIIDLYDKCIDSSTREYLSEQFDDETRPPIGEIVWKIRTYHKSENEAGERRWWLRLTTAERGYMKRLLKRPQWRDAFDALLVIPGLWKSMVLSSLPKIWATRCDQEFLCYLEHIKAVWTSLVDDPSALQRIDSKTIDEVELCAPSLCAAEYVSLKSKTQNGEIFGSFPLAEREAILGKLHKVQGIVPSFRSFFSDWRYLSIISNRIRHLVSIPDRGTLREALKDAFYEQNRSEEAFISAYAQLVAFVMRNYLHIPHTLNNKDKLADHDLRINTRILSALAKFAYELEFRSVEINQLRVKDSDWKEDPLSDEAGCPPAMTNNTERSAISRCRRCGCPTKEEYHRDRSSLSVRYLTQSVTGHERVLNSLHVRKDIYHRFFSITNTFHQAHIHMQNADAPTDISHVEAQQTTAQPTTNDIDMPTVPSTEERATNSDSMDNANMHGDSIQEPRTASPPTTNDIDMPTVTSVEVQRATAQPTTNDVDMPTVPSAEERATISDSMNNANMHGYSIQEPATDGSETTSDFSSNFGMHADPTVEKEGREAASSPDDASVQEASGSNGEEHLNDEEHEKETPAPSKLALVVGSKRVTMIGNLESYMAAPDETHERDREDKQRESDKDLFESGTEDDDESDEDESLIPTTKTDPRTSDGDGAAAEDESLQAVSKDTNSQLPIAADGVTGHDPLQAASDTSQEPLSRIYTAADDQPLPVASTRDTGSQQSTGVNAVTQDEILRPKSMPGSSQQPPIGVDAATEHDSSQGVSTTDAASNPAIIKFTGTAHARPYLKRQGIDFKAKELSSNKSTFQKRNAMKLLESIPKIQIRNSSEADAESRYGGSRLKYRIYRYPAEEAQIVVFSPVPQNQADNEISRQQDDTVLRPQDKVARHQLENADTIVFSEWDPMKQQLIEEYDSGRILYDLNGQITTAYDLNMKTYISVPKTFKRDVTFDSFIVGLQPMETGERKRRARFLDSNYDPDECMDV